MTPEKKKAEELANKYFKEFTDEDYSNVKYQFLYESHWEIAKACARLAVEEILKALKCDHIYYQSDIYFIYWESVKQEIDKL